MRSQMTRLTVPAVLVCLALVSTSGAWARPVKEPAPVPKQESSLVDNLLEWVQSLLERHGFPHTPPVPETPAFQQEGPQMDPNGTTGPH